ncbi:hypothetical protein FRB90_006740 [Tulasnella sp. 427]|nr:hypothetical protein FRB90_006740 [Tulasnella sp. 427]
MQSASIESNRTFEPTVDNMIRLNFTKNSVYNTIISSENNDIIYEITTPGIFSNADRVTAIFKCDRLSEKKMLVAEISWKAMRSRTAIRLGGPTFEWVPVREWLVDSKGISATKTFTTAEGTQYCWKIRNLKRHLTKLGNASEGPNPSLAILHYPFFKGISPAYLDVSTLVLQDLDDIIGNLLLNYRKLPYRTEWVSYPDVQDTFEKLGMKPSGVKEDGSGRPHYTCPSIIDPTTPESTRVTESTEIALYLEDAYPEVQPKVFPQGGREAQLEFIKVVKPLIVEPAIKLILPQMPAILLDPRGSEYFERTRTINYGRPLQSLCLAGTEERKKAWEDFKTGLSKVAEIYDKNPEGKGEYFTGNAISYADIWLAALFLWCKVPCDRDPELGAGSVWDVVEKLNDGRWARFMAKFDDYLQVS